MPWWTSWSRSTSSRQILCACLLAVLLLGITGPTPAQESFDQRLQRAKDLFNTAKMEEACDVLQQLDKEKSGDKQTQAYLKMSCEQVKRLQKTEEDLFNQGVQLFNQGQLDDARQKFEQSGRIQGLKNFRYHAKALQYLTQIDEALRKQRATEVITKSFDSAVRLYNAGNYADAFLAFDKIVKAGGLKAAEAQDYLRKIEQARQKEVAKKEAPRRPVKEETTTGPSAQAPPKGVEAPSGQQPTASEQTLRAGLKAYFAGDLDEAERDLSDYLANNGQKQELAHFFRGAAHSARYFLSGEKDSRQKDLALSDFQSAQNRGRAFEPPQKYVPPKILALYSQAASATSQ